MPASGNAGSANGASLSQSEIARLLPAAPDMPAEEGARLLTLFWLRELEASSSEAGRRSDGRSILPAGDGIGDDLAVVEAAHVAVCGLASSLREHRALLDTKPHLSRSVRKLERSLAATLRAAAQASWLERYLASHDQPLALAAGALRSRCDEEIPSLRAICRTLERALRDVREPLESQLSEYTERRHVGRPPVRRSLAAHLAARITKGAAAIGSDFADARLQKLRMRLASQRGLLAPFARAQERSQHASGAWLYRCAGMGAALRSLHEIERLAKRARRAEFIALASALQSDADALLANARLSWPPDSLSLARSAAAVFDGNAAASVLPREIERKFLLRAAPDAIAEVLPVFIEQGWLPGNVLRERLRRTTHADGRTLLTRTVKAGALGNRIELEEEASPALFEAMWPHTRSARIRKHRYALPDAGFTWEIDVFLDRDLVLAEVELTDEADVPAFPEWLAPFVVRDVTDDPSFTNSEMAARDTPIGVEAIPDPDLDASLGG